MAQKQQVRLSLSPNAYAMVETARTVRECTMSDVIEAAIVAYLDPEASDDKLNMVLNQLAILIARTAPQEPSAAAAPPAEPVISSEAFYRKLGTWEVELPAPVIPVPIPSKRGLLTRIFRQEE